MRRISVTRRRLGQEGQAATETLLMMSFLMLLVFGFVHFCMLATTKLMVNYAAFSAARATLIATDSSARRISSPYAHLGAVSALEYFRWSDQPPVTFGAVDRTFRGVTRRGWFVTYVVPFGLPLYSSLPGRGLEVVAFAPYEHQPSENDKAHEEGDNAQ